MATCRLGKCMLPTIFVLLECFSASMPPRRQHQTVSGQRQNSLTLLSLGLFWAASFLTQLKFFVPMEFLGFVPHSFTTNTAMGTNILDMCIIKSKIPLGKLARYVLSGYPPFIESCVQFIISHPAFIKGKCVTP